MLVSLLSPTAWKISRVHERNNSKPLIGRVGDLSLSEWWYGAERSTVRLKCLARSYGQLPQRDKHPDCSLDRNAHHLQDDLTIRVIVVCSVITHHAERRLGLDAFFINDEQREVHKRVYTSTFGCRT